MFGGREGGIWVYMEGRRIMGGRNVMVRLRGVRVKRGEFYEVVGDEVGIGSEGRG